MKTNLDIIRMQLGRLREGLKLIHKTKKILSIHVYNRLCFTAQSIQWGHVEHLSLPNHTFTGQA